MAFSQPSQRTWAQVALGNTTRHRMSFSGLDEAVWPKVPSLGMNKAPKAHELYKLLPPEETDPTNTRIFVKLVPATNIDLALLFAAFRPFGKIRSISINTKRSNAIVDYTMKVQHIDHIAYTIPVCVCSI
jgi:hypothetical protein